MQQNNFPPPPPVGFPPPPTAAPLAQHFQTQGFPQPTATQPGFGALPPTAQAYAPPPQGFAAPAPQGFQQPVNLPDVDLNAVNADGLNLLPQCAFTGVLRVRGFVKGMRPLAGACYTATLEVESSTAPEMPVGCVFNQLMKISGNPMKPGGDRTRKQFLAGVFGLNPNSQQDWRAIDLQLQQHDFNATPVRVQLQQTPDYSRPMLDKTTRQPLPGQFWARQNWSRPQP